MTMDLNRRAAAVLLWALCPASAGAISFGVGNAVAKQGATILNKVVTPPLPSCGGDFQPFTQAPIADANFLGLSPLGSQSEHILPPDHMYLNTYNSNDAGQPLYAPGNGWVVQVTASRPTAGGSNYSVVFSPCAEVALSFMGLPAMSAGLAAAVAGAPAYNTSCSSYSTDGGGSSCVTNLQYPVSAGQILGSGVFVDFGPLQDSRINLTGFANPSRHDLHRGFCPLSYFKGGVLPSSQWTTGDYVGGTWNGTTYVPGTGTYVARSTTPACGTIVQDIPGTAQGDWYTPTSPNAPEASFTYENNQMALVHDSVFWSSAVFSVGIADPLYPSLPSGGGQTYKAFFMPKTNPDGTFKADPSRIDIDFSLVRNDGDIYCYDTLNTFAPQQNPNYTNLSGYIILLRLIDANDLRIEAQFAGAGANCTTTSGTWAFTPAAVSLQR